MARRKGGLGPQGHAAVERAVRELQRRPEKTTAPVEDPQNFESPLEQGNPAAITQETNERDTIPDNWWVPPRGSILPDRSTRVASAGYDKGSQRLYVLFHKPYPEGTPWTYEGVTENEWRSLKRTWSAGKFVNRILNQKDYHRGTLLD